MRFHVPFLSLNSDNPLDHTRRLSLTSEQFCDYACKVAGIYRETPAFLARCRFGPNKLPYNPTLRNMPLGSPERASQWLSQFPTITLDEAKRIVEKAGLTPTITRADDYKLAAPSER